MVVEFLQPFRSSNNNNSRLTPAKSSPRGGGGRHSNVHNSGATAHSIASQASRQSDNTRPRKQPCQGQGLFPDSPETDGAVHNKQNLIDNLNRTYCPFDDNDSDEGDVSGEDVFSEDEVERRVHGTHVTFSSLPSASFGHKPVPNPSATAAKGAVRLHDQRLTNGGAGQKQPCLGGQRSYDNVGMGDREESYLGSHLSFASDTEKERVNRCRDLFIGVADQRQAILEHSLSSRESSSYHSSHVSKVYLTHVSQGHLDGGRPSTQPGRGRATGSDSNWGPTQKSRYNSSRSTQEVPTRDYLLNQMQVGGQQNPVHGSHLTIASNRETERSNRLYQGQSSSASVHSSYDVSSQSGRAIGTGSNWGAIKSRPSRSGHTSSLGSTQEVPTRVHPNMMLHPHSLPSSGSSHTDRSYTSSVHLGGGMTSSQLGRAATSGLNRVPSASISINTGHHSTNSSQQGFTRGDPNMVMHQGNIPGGLNPRHSTLTLGERISAPAAASFSGRDLIHSKVSRPGKPPPTQGLTKQQERSRGLFAHLEAKILQNEALNRSQHSSSTSSQPPTELAGRGRAVVRDEPHGNSVSSRGASRTYQHPGGAGMAGLGFVIASGGSSSARSRHSASLREVNRKGMQTSPQNSMSQGKTSSGSESSQNTSAETSCSSMHSNIGHVVQNSSLRSTQTSSSTSQDRRHSCNVFADTEAAMSHRAEGNVNVSSGWASRNALSQRTEGYTSASERWGSRSSNMFESQPQSFQRRACSSSNARSLRGRSRDVIASIEADMMRLEEEEETGNNHGVQIQHGAINPHGQNLRSVLTHGGRQPAGMNQRDALNIMMQQQQRLQSGSLSHAHGNRTLADQISDMAIDPLSFEAYGDDSSAKSMNSCISYDGKCTNIFAARAETRKQELACHELNNAICDLYGAPVERILRQHPTVTRLIRADDENGNVQLHYAVRHGNVKAIRRITRADPGCAVIRNIQGYCPIHLAVQAGNFAAVQLLCYMVPPSAEVQCEEGCLPLHEAVSSAAHLPDAPQIVAALINAFPSAIKITNDEGLLPLHLCAMSGFSAGIRTIFAYGFSTVYARENTEEMLPLDFAIDGYKATLEELEEETSEEASSGAELKAKETKFRQCIDIFLMSALYDRPVFTPSGNEPRGSTFLPIHGAAVAQPCSESWQTIKSMYGSEYASHVDVRGRTALHVLATTTLSHHLEIVTEMITDIIELDPSSATTFDDSGLIPLHAALMNLMPYPIINHLLACTPVTVSMEVDEDCDSVQFRGMLPFQLAAACGCSASVVNMLLRAHPIGVFGAIHTGGK